MRKFVVALPNLPTAFAACVGDCATAAGVEG